jgi:hypothetical protein
MDRGLSLHSCCIDISRKKSKMGYTFGGKDREGVVMTANEPEKFSEEIVKDALIRLSSVGQYTALMEMLPNVNVFKGKKFRSDYEEFYKLKRYPAEFRDAYFAFMQKNKGNASLTFEKVLARLRTFRGTVEASFASKLLHTLRPGFPTWDRWIGKHTGIKIPGPGVKDQFTVAVERYDKLTAWFNNYIHSKTGKATLRLFNRYYPAFSLTDTKKIDLVLWQMKLEKEKALKALRARIKVVGDGLFQVEDTADMIRDAIGDPYWQPERENSKG